jgi:hypothetical protein
MSEEQVGKVLRGVANIAFGGDLGGVASSLLGDNHGTWDPVVPHDLHANPLPPVAPDGTAECWQCQTRFAFAQLDISGNAYSCRPCLLRTAQANAPAPELDLKIERSWGRILAVFALVALAIGVGVVIVIARVP